MSEIAYTKAITTKDLEITAEIERLHLTAKTLEDRSQVLLTRLEPAMGLPSPVEGKAEMSNTSAIGQTLEELRCVLNSIDERLISILDRLQF